MPKAFPLLVKGNINLRHDDCNSVSNSLFVFYSHEFMTIGRRSISKKGCV